MDKSNFGDDILKILAIALIESLIKLHRLLGLLENNDYDKLILSIFNIL